VTDYTLSSGNTIRPHRSPWGSFPVRGLKLSTGISSAVIRVGQIVALDTSTAYADCIIPATTSSATISVTAGLIAGVAADTPGAVDGRPGLGSTNSANTVISVWDCNPNCEFKAWTRGGLITSTLVGSCRPVVRDTTLNIDLIALGASALNTPANFAIVTAIADPYVSGDSGGAVIFRFNTSSGYLAYYH